MGKTIKISTTQGNLSLFVASPNAGIRGGVIIIHEVWGLTDHIKDVTNRVANAGYLAIAPDLLSKDLDIGMISELQEDLFNPERRNDAQPKLRKMLTPLFNSKFSNLTTTKLLDCFSYLYDKSEVKQKIAVIGFCFGGTYSFSLAVKEPRLKLAVPFYGHSDFTIEDMKSIRCPVRAFYGENDENLIHTLPDLKDKMLAAGVDFKAKVYQNCGHAFFNNTNKFAFNQAASIDSWQRVLKLLELCLK
jgi:carboxymethylenebutenolidase